ncbi:MAG: B12-binding domain-containing radical SAM protein [Candidatus Omnitrophica bacterium]|nr:B12-binding domain-containing radical SAM protein [Candidatus Omnitrophota bacterium]
MREKEKKTNPEILFIFPGFQDNALLSFTLDYNLGSGYILAYLKKKGIRAKQFIHRDPITLNELADKILDQAGQIVGFTCLDINYYFVKLISQLLKKRNPKLTIIAGGPTATFSDKLIMQDNSAIDICVRAEAEQSAYELVKRLRTSQDISDIQGITYRIKSKLMRSPDRPPIRGDNKDAGLDIFPSPYLENILVPDGCIGVLSSRGCVFKCVYCNFSAMSGWRISYHSVDRVVSELKMISNWLENKDIQARARTIRIMDDAFSLDVGRAKQVCRRIIEEKIHLPLGTMTRADRVDKELLHLMYRAGFKDIGFGLESTSPRVLRIIKKVRTNLNNEDNFLPEKRFVSKLKENVKIAKEIGLTPKVNIIMGLPGSSIKDDRETVRFVRQLELPDCSYNYLRIFQGTELSKTYKDHGLEIIRPLTRLPLQTQYTYDERKMPHIKNHDQSIIEINTGEELSRLLTGTYSNTCKGAYPDLLMRENYLDSKTLHWLRNYAEIAPAIGFLTSYAEDKVFYRLMKKIISAGLPISNIYLFSLLNNDGINPADLNPISGRYKVTFASEILSNKTKRFLNLGLFKFIPFGSYRNNHSASKGSNVTDKLIFNLSTPKDIESLIDLASFSDNLILKGDMAKSDCYFLDECRFSDEECPALSFRRAIINRDNSIIPCFNAKPIAKVGQEPKTIARNMNMLSSNLKNKRGCNSCLAKDSCPKCLFPYPLSDREYCRLIRNSHSKINMMFKFFSALRRLRFDYNEIEPRSNFNRMKVQIDNELLITIGRRKYLYNSHVDKLHRLERRA